MAVHAAAWQHVACVSCLRLRALLGVDDLLPLDVGALKRLDPRRVERLRGAHKLPELLEVVGHLRTRRLRVDRAAAEREDGDVDVARRELLADGRLHHQREGGRQGIARGVA